MAQDLFAPPSPEELKLAQSMRVSPNVSGGAPAPDLFAPPSADELKAAQGPEQPTMLRKGLSTAGRVLDYPGGLLRTGIASVAGQLSGHPNAVSDDDVAKAFKGQAPSSSEYMERMGVTPGPSVNLPSAEFDVPYLGKIKTPDNISLRDAEGFALDVATDPLTALSRGEKALKPIGSAAEAAGEKMYKSGLKKVDEKLLERGAKPVSDVLLNAGKTGTTSQLQTAAREIGEGLGKERQALYKQATDKGVTIDMAHPLPGAEAEIERMRSDPGLAPMADSLQETLDRYKAGGKVDIGKLSDWKSNLYNALPQTAYDAQGRLTAPAKRFQKALASDFKEAIVDAGNKAEKGLGDKINEINDKWSTVIQADKPLTMQARRANTTNMITPVDAMLTGLGGVASHDPVTTIGLLAAKKAADLSKTTAARTVAGKGLLDIGKSGLLDASGRRMLAVPDNKRKGILGEPRGMLSGGE